MGRDCMSAKNCAVVAKNCAVDGTKFYSLLRFSKFSSSRCLALIVNKFASIANFDRN